MSLRHYITAAWKCKANRRKIICRLIEDVVFLYLMGAGIWVVFRLVGEIFEKLGVE